MFDIYERGGAKIASVNEDELYKLRKEGIIKVTDKIYDTITGERIK